MPPNFGNRTLFHGDNIDFLRGMNSGTIHLIATDPPFNKNRDFHATPDRLAEGAQFDDRWRWEEESHPRWMDGIKDDWRSEGGSNRIENRLLPCGPCNLIKSNTLTLTGLRAENERRGRMAGRR